MKINLQIGELKTAILDDVTLVRNPFLTNRTKKGQT